MVLKFKSVSLINELIQQAYWHACPDSTELMQIESLEQWFSTLLVLWPFNTIPQVVVTRRIIFIATS